MVKPQVSTFETTISKETDDYFEHLKQTSVQGMAAFIL